MRIVRPQPDIDLTVSAAVRAGTELEIYDTRENEDGLWYEVYQDNRRLGWVLAEYVISQCE